MCHYDVSLDLFFLGNPIVIAQTTKNICGELVTGEWLASKKACAFLRRVWIRPMATIPVNHDRSLPQAGMVSA